MNTTNRPTQTNEIPDFTLQCLRLGIDLPENTLASAELIPIVEQRLAGHRRLPLVDFPGSEAQWKSIYVALTDLLDNLKLAAASKNSDVSEPGQNSESAEPQPSPDRTIPGQSRTDSGQTRTERGQERTQSGQDRTQPGQPDSAAEEFVPPIIKSDDEDFLEAAADLHFRLKGRSRFDKLTPQQQDAIIALLEVHTVRAVVKLLAEAPPIGFSFKIGKSALNAFHLRYKKREVELRTKHDTQAVIDLLNKSEDPNQAFVQTFERLLQIKALTAASDSSSTLETLDALTSTLTKFRKQTLAERKQIFAEKTKTQNRAQQGT